MRHVLSALAGVIAIVVMVVSTLFISTAPSPAAPLQEAEGCVLTVAEVKVCGTLLDQPLPETVTVPPITLPPVTVPGPTVTVRPDPIRTTVTVRPSPVTVRPDPVRITQTVTAAPQPQPTATVTVTKSVPTPGPVDNTPEPQATVTETVKPNGQPVPTVTETVTVTPSPQAGQNVSPSDTVEPSKEDEPFFSTDVDFGDDDVTAAEAGIGLLSALALIALIVAGMSYGFYRGRRSVAKEETRFLRAILDRSKTS